MQLSIKIKIRRAVIISLTCKYDLILLLIYNYKLYFILRNSVIECNIKFLTITLDRYNSQCLIDI